MTIGNGANPLMEPILLNDASPKLHIILLAQTTRKD